MVLYICLFQNIMFGFMPEDDFGIKLKASKKLKKKNNVLNSVSSLLIEKINRNKNVFSRSLFPKTRYPKICCLIFFRANILITNFRPIYCRSSSG